jgi:hypothetical protein
MMDFVGIPPDRMALIRGGTSWQVFASGNVNPNDHEKLSQFLLTNKIPFGSEIYIHSAGGSLVGGMSFGKVIREHGMISHVGRQGNFEDGFQETLDGYCMSAAALAFLGGDFRFVGERSQYGVHRFTVEDATAKDIDGAQKISASVVEYIESMGVNIELFSIASEWAPDDIFVIPPPTLKRLNVVNGGFKPVEWSIESIDGALYLKGARDTIYGMQKFLLVFPSDGDMWMHIIFDGGMDADDMLSMESDRLLIDSEYVLLHELRVSRFSDNGRINMMYKVTDEILNKLKGAKKIGFILQHFADAFIFVGFDQFPFENGASKLPGLLSLFRRGGTSNGESAAVSR